MNITIDGVTFTLLYKSIADNLVYHLSDAEIVECHRDCGFPVIVENLRDVVQFRSTDQDGNTIILHAYRSTSELGIWRLGYLNRIKCMLNKFNLDYIQGTVIHHELQKFINENLDAVPYMPENITGTIFAENHPRNKPFVDSVPEGSEERKKHVFILLKFPTPSEEAYIDHVERKKTVSPFSDIKSRCDIKIGERQIFKDLQNLTRKIRLKYTIDMESNRVIIEYPFESLTDNMKNGVIQINTIRFLPKKSHDKPVILVYCKYSLEYGENSTHATGYYGIALLQDDTCNKYGIYKSFIEAGIYICKPVVYKSKCSLDPSVMKSCNRLYAFVGNRYNDVAPYAELEGRLFPSRGSLSSRAYSYDSHYSKTKPRKKGITRRGKKKSRSSMKRQTKSV
jgi:hypothetical protein